MRRFLALFAVLMLSGVLATAQEHSVKGHVTGPDGSSLPGITVQVKGTNNATATDANGQFELTLPPNSTLVFTGVGFEEQSLKAGDRTSLDVTLASNTKRLNEVVVTALGIQRQARSLGYATAKVNSSEITQARVTNAGEGLAAKVSGLQVDLTNNGVKPDLRIVLRGNRSILGNNQPLLVVDDIPLPITYLATLNPDDINNITVLKGGSASALYGSSASNGVIIVTTNKGRSGKPQVKLSSTATVESIAYTPKFQNEFGQWGGEPLGFPGTYPMPGFLSTGPQAVLYAEFENENYGPRFNGQLVPIGFPITIFNPDGTSYQKQDSTLYSAVPNAKTGFFNKGLTTQNEISYSAGDDKSKFYLSFQDVNAAGIVPKDVSRRDAFRVNGSREFGIFRADYNIGYTLTHNNTTAGAGVPFDWGTTGSFGGYPGGGSYFQNRAVYWDIINQPADVNLANYKNWQTNPFASPDGYFNAYYGNPWWQIDQVRLDEKQSDLLGNLTLTLKPLSWLTLQYKANIARDDYSNKFTQAGYNFADWAINDPNYNQAGSIPGAVKTYFPAEGDAQSYSQNLTTAFLVSANKTFGKFDFRFIAGNQILDNTNNYLQVSASTLVIPDFYNVNNVLGKPNVGQTLTEIRTYGVFGDLTVGYKDLLFLHGSLRNDWTSLLSKANQSYLYPSVDAAFVFTDAIPSLKNSNVISYGKIRGGYSQTAQVSIGAYSLQNVFNVGGGFPFGGVAGYTLGTSFANPDIKPEISSNQEIGLEMGFLENRINFSAAAYTTSTKNQTIQISTSAATGYTQAYVNSGVMQNKGIELDLKLNILKTKSGLSWDIGGNYAYNKNTVQSLGYGLSQVNIPNYTNQDANSNAQTFNSVAAIGLPYGQVQTNDWKRDSQGRIIVDPNTGLPSLDPNLHLFGTSVPPTTVGLFTTLSYKGFTLNIVGDGRFGAVIYNGIGGSLDFTGVSAYSASSGRQPFIIPNSVTVDANGKSTPNTTITTSSGNNQFWANVWNKPGSNYVNSADFWKLRELSLSYNFPPDLVRHLKIVHALTLGVTGRNLLTWRAKGNVWSDPEFSNTNGNATGNTDINQLPPTKFIGANLSVTF